VPVLIDLDVPPPPSPPRQRRRLRFEVIVAAVLLVVLALLLGAAAAPRRHGLTEVLRTGGRRVTASLLTPSVIFVGQDGQDGPSGPNGTVVSALPLERGAPRWRTATNLARPEFTLVAGGSILVVAPAGPLRAEDGTDRTGPTAFLDARSGRRLWQTPEAAQVAIAGDRVGLSADGRLWAAGLRTGRTIWSRRADLQYLTSDRSHRLLIGIGTDDGRGSVYDASDGRVRVASRDLRLDPSLWTGGYPNEFVGWTAAGEQFYAFGTSFVAAYRLPDLKRGWRTRVETPTGVHLCGGVVCTDGPGPVVLLDPRTGAARPALDPPSGSGRTTGDLRLADDRDRMWVTDLRSGRVLEALAGVSTADCMSTGRYLACQTGGTGLTVWRYQVT
jgi:putative pyrroloquinoline-quinone binding quinoprotein